MAKNFAHGETTSRNSSTFQNQPSWDDNQSHSLNVNQSGSRSEETWLTLRENKRRQKTKEFRPLPPHLQSPEAIEAYINSRVDGVKTAESEQGLSLENTKVAQSIAAAPQQQPNLEPQPQKVAQTSAQPERAWLNSGVSATGGIETIPFDGRIVRTTKDGKQVIIPVKFGQKFQTQPGDQMQYSMIIDYGTQKTNPSAQANPVDTFKAKLSNNALKRLQDNSNRLKSELKDYQNLSPSNAKWQQLRQMASKDQQLVQRDQQLNHQIANLVMKDRKETSFTSPNTFIDRDDVAHLGVINPKIQAQIKELEGQQALLKIARRQMQAQYPALAVVDSAKVASSSNQELLGNINQGFGQIQGTIGDLQKQIQADPSKALFLDDVVKGTLSGLKVDPNNPNQTKTGKEITNWLQGEQTKHNLIKWGGTLLTGGLTVGAIITTLATEGLALPFWLGLGGAVTGLGTAVYEYKELATVDLAAQAQQGGGGNLTSQDKDTARFNLMMGRINLLMAGLDVGLSVKAVVGMLKGARSAGQMSTLAKAIKDKDRVVLELFGGKEGKVPGAINVDIVAEKGIRADLMKDKLSFIPNNSVDEIVTFNPYIPKEAGGTGIMDYLPEAARVLKPGGRIIVSGTNNNKFAQLKGSVDLQKMNLRIVEQKIPLPDNFKDLTFHRIDGSELPTDKMVTTILEKIK
jgi:SAM-dependent methyltransferase